jgi:hypothetical protein
MDFWKELCLSGIAGLTWLSYNRPGFARKILYALLICCTLIQAGLRIYQWGYNDCQTHISNEFARHLSRSGLSKGKKKRLDSRVTSILQNSSPRINNAIERYSFYLDIAVVIFVVLIFFCISVGFDRQSNRAD